MNLENFYSITSHKLVAEQSLHVQVTLNPTHAIFEGHFPDHPVLPGVAMLQIVKNILEDHLSCSLVMQTAKRIKFVHLVNPQQNDTLVFTISFQQENGLLKVKNSTTFVDELPVMHGDITYALR